MRLLGAISEASGAFLEALGAAGSGFYVQKSIFGDFEMILDEFSVSKSHQKALRVARKIGTVFDIDSQYIFD